MNLFEDLFEKIKQGLYELCDEQDLHFKGLWAFSYLEGANSLQSVYFNHVDIDKLQLHFPQILSEIETTRLDCDYGSLGFSFLALKNDNRQIAVIKDTYNDPKGTVCYFDTIISQQHAYFILVQNSDETLGVLDFIFAGNLCSAISSKVEHYFLSKFQNSNTGNYLVDFISAFKVKEFEDFLKLQSETGRTGFDPNESPISKELSTVTRFIERLLSVSCETPLLIVSQFKDRIEPELVALNFDFIHSIISHEHRFCPLTSKKECFYFKDFTSFIGTNLKCDNLFLTSYYYDVYKALNAKLHTLEILVGTTKYKVDIACSDQYNWSDISSSEISELNKEIQYNETLFNNDIATCKYRDERVFMMLDRRLNECKQHVYALSLSREVEKHIKLVTGSESDLNDCVSRNSCICDKGKHIKQFISPSTTLPVQYGDTSEKLLEKKSYKSEQIVHFKIINEEVFIKTLKRLISIKPQHYCEVLSPYIRSSPDRYHEKKHHNLTLVYVGEDPIREHSNKYAETIKGKLNYIEALLQEDEIRTHARKAAISQVFARNGSHNMGSHVLAKMITKDAAKHNFKGDTNNYDPIEGLTKVHGEDGKYIAIANFNSYLRDRMDFLADLSTSTPLMEVSKALMNDVLAGMDANRILMNYISGVSSFEYSLQMRDCLECENKKCESPCNKVEVSSGTDIQVSVPNDVMGFHALYIIIENVIRNTAKHGGSTKPVKFTLEVRQCVQDNTLYEIWLYDTCKKEAVLTDEEKKEYKTKTGLDADDQQKKIDLIVARQNANINEPILDPDTNGLRHGAWGIIEMKVAAAYLRKIPVETVDQIEYQVNLKETNEFFTVTNIQNIPNIIKAVNKEGALGYVFHLMKPKELLVIDEKGNLYEELNKQSDGNQSPTKLQQLKDQGVWVQKDIEVNKVYPHPFMYIIPENVFDKEKYLKKDGLYKGNLPTRILVEGKAPKELENNRWVAWTKNNGQEEKIEEKLKNLFPTNSEGNKEGKVAPLQIKPILLLIWKTWLKYCLSCNQIPENKIGTSKIDNLYDPDDFWSPNFRKLINGNDVSASLSFNISFDHHGENISQAFNGDKCKFQHFEAYPSAVKQFMEKAENDLQYTALLFDGILNNIIIVDERVQAIYQEKYYPEKGDPFNNNQKRMRAANIHIPDKSDIDLNKTNFDEADSNQLQNAILNATKDLCLKNGADIIVIHLGVIERLLEAQNKNKGKDEVRKFIQKLTAKFDARVVITSGRGKPDNLPEEVPFLTYSALSHYAIETPFKAALNQAIQTTRIFNEN